MADFGEVMAMLEFDKKVIRELTAVETDFVAGGTGAGCYPTDTTVPPDTMTTITTTIDPTLTTLTTTTTLTS